MQQPFSLDKDKTEAAKVDTCMCSLYRKDLLSLRTIAIFHIQHSRQGHRATSPSATNHQTLWAFMAFADVAVPEQ
jgi:hypothetical protein